MDLFSKGINESLDLGFRALNELNKSTLSLNLDALFENMAKQAAKNIEDILNTIKESTKRTMDVFSDVMAEETRKFTTILLENGWPPHNTLNMNHMIEIIEIHESNANKINVKTEIDRLFLDFYSIDQINRMFKVWKSKGWLKDRISILNDCVYAHNKGKYSLTVPTLLTQIEGIIADGFSHNGRMDNDVLKNYINDLLNRGDRFSYDTAIEEFYLENLLAGFKHGFPLKSFLSRHAILHGGDTNYGTKLNSLKCLLLFDYLQNKFGFVCLPNGEVYHKIDCRIVKKFRNSHPVNKLTVYDNSYQADKAGKSYCGYCINENDKVVNDAISVVTLNKTNDIINP